MIIPMWFATICLLWPPICNSFKLWGPHWHENSKKVFTKRWLQKQDPISQRRVNFEPWISSVAGGAAAGMARWFVITLRLGYCGIYYCFERRNVIWHVFWPTGTPVVAIRYAPTIWRIFLCDSGANDKIINLVRRMERYVFEDRRLIIRMLWNIDRILLLFAIAIHRHGDDSGWRRKKLLWYLLFHCLMRNIVSGQKAKYGTPNFTRFVLSWLSIALLRKEFFYGRECFEIPTPVAVVRAHSEPGPEYIR